MLFHFDPQKTTQAAAVLLSLEGRVMDRIRLLKLLYLADRELLIARGRPITGDEAVAMNRGPVPSHTYHLIRGDEQSPEDWGRHIRSVAKKVILMGDPGHGELSRTEIETLERVSDRYRSLTTAGLSALTHEFAEWRDNFIPDTARPIPWVEVLQAAGRADQVATFEARLAEQNLLDSIFATGAEADDGR